MRHPEGELPNSSEGHCTIKEGSPLASSHANTALGLFDSVEISHTCNTTTNGDTELETQLGIKGVKTPATIQSGNIDVQTSTHTPDSVLL